MKVLSVVLVLLASLAFASASDLGAVHHSGTSSYSGGTDAVVYAQPYVFADVANGIRHYSVAESEGWGTDDFVLNTASEIHGIQFYIVYSGVAPTSYDLVIGQDAGDSDPNNYTEVWSANVPCTLVDTGDENWGMTIWEVNCDIPSSFPNLTAGPIYWLAIAFHEEAVYEYILVNATVAGGMAWSGVTQTTYATTLATFGTPYDFFFNLYDAPTSLERQTWGSIKSLY